MSTDHLADFVTRLTADFFGKVLTDERGDAAPEHLRAEDGQKHRECRAHGAHGQAHCQPRPCQRAGDSSGEQLRGCRTIDAAEREVVEEAARS